MCLVGLAENPRNIYFQTILWITFGLSFVRFMGFCCERSLPRKTICYQLTHLMPHRLHVWRSRLPSSEIVRQKRPEVTITRSIVKGAQRRRRTLMYLKNASLILQISFQCITSGILHTHLWLLVSTPRFLTCAVNFSASYAYVGLCERTYDRGQRCESLCVMANRIWPSMKPLPNRRLLDIVVLRWERPDLPLPSLHLDSIRQPLASCDRYYSLRCLPCWVVLAAPARAPM